MFLLAYTIFFQIHVRMLFWTHFRLSKRKFCFIKTKLDFSIYLKSKLKSPRDQNTGAAHPEANVSHKKQAQENKRKWYLTSTQWLYKVQKSLFLSDIPQEKHNSSKIIVVIIGKQSNGVVWFVAFPLVAAGLQQVRRLLRQSAAATQFTGPWRKKRKDRGLTNQALGRHTLITPLDNFNLNTKISQTKAAKHQNLAVLKAFSHPCILSIKTHKSASLTILYVLLIHMYYCCKSLIKPFRVPVGVVHFTLLTFLRPPLPHLCL